MSIRRLSPAGLLAAAGLPETGPWEDPEETLSEAIEILAARAVTDAGEVLPRLGEALCRRSVLRRRRDAARSAERDADLAVRVWGWLCEELDELPEAVLQAAGLPLHGAAAEGVSRALHGSMEDQSRAWLSGLVLSLVERSDVESERDEPIQARRSAEAALERAGWLMDIDGADARVELAVALGAVGRRAAEEGELDEAAGHLETQADVWEDLERPFLAAEAWSSAGRCLLESGSASDALELIEQALDCLEVAEERFQDATSVDILLDPVFLTVPDEGLRGPISVRSVALMRALVLEDRCGCAVGLRDPADGVSQSTRAAAAWQELGVAGRPGLVRSLALAADCLTELGERTQALETAQRAASMAAELSDDVLSPEDRVWVLNAWSRALSDLGRLEDALKVSEEQVQQLRLYEARLGGPAVPQLAISLVNLAVDLKELGRGEAALAAAREGVARLRRLAVEEPGLRADLSAGLVELSTCAGWMGHLEVALEHIQEANALYAELSQEDPDGYGADAAVALSNEGGLRWRQGDRAAAIACKRQAVTLLGPFAERVPASYGPMLATVLTNLAGVLTDDGQLGQALSVAERATGLVRMLHADLPDAFARSLALALNNLGGVHFELDRFEEALEAFVEAQALLGEDRSPGYAGALAEVRGNVAACLVELKRPSDALEPAEEAVDIQRSAFASRPEAVRSLLARALSVRGTARVRTGSIGDGLEDLQEALRVVGPELQRRARATSDLWEWVGDRYVEACEAAGVAPDPVLLVGGAADSW